MLYRDPRKSLSSKRWTLIIVRDPEDYRPNQNGRDRKISPGLGCPRAEEGTVEQEETPPNGASEGAAHFPMVRRLGWLEPVFLVLLALALNLAGNGRTGLWDRDEPRYAVCVREMRARGDWMFPTFNGEPRYHKPILIYWLMGLATALGGDNPFGVRLVSAVAGAGTVLGVWLLGRRMLGPRAGRLAALILATAPIVVAESKLATTDATLALLLFGCQACLWVLGQRPSRCAAALFWVLLSLATLTKGPVGPALIAIASLFAWWWGWPASAWKRLYWRRGLLGFLILTAPWYVAISIASGGEFLQFAVGQPDRAPHCIRHGGAWRLPRILSGGLGLGLLSLVRAGSGGRPRSMAPPQVQHSPRLSAGLGDRAALVAGVFPHQVDPLLLAGISRVCIAPGLAGAVGVGRGGEHSALAFGTAGNGPPGRDRIGRHRTPGGGSHDRAVEPLSAHGSGRNRHGGRHAPWPLVVSARSNRARDLLSGRDVDCWCCWSSPDGWSRWPSPTERRGSLVSAWRPCRRRWDWNRSCSNTRSPAWSMRSDGRSPLRAIATASSPISKAVGLYSRWRWRVISKSSVQSSGCR